MSKHISKFTGAEIDAKLSKVNQEFTNVEKNKLAALKNYDDSEINTAIKNNKTNIEANAAAIKEVKSSVSNLQTTKANSSDVYTKKEVYTKTETDNKITSKVAEIIAGAPEDLNTLKEMSDWIDGHEDSAAAMNSAIAANTAKIETKLDKTALQWGLIPTEYSTMGDYILTLPIGKHQLFYRNASDTHITDMPVNANMFIDVLKYSNTTIRVNAYPSRQIADTMYSRAYSGGAWGNWYAFTGAIVE